MIRLHFLTCILMGYATSLRLEDADEGSCRGLPSQPVPLQDLSFMDRLTYVAGASRSHYYTIASSHPHFGQMRHSELVNNMCLTHDIPLSPLVGHGAVFGFGGRNLGNFTGRQLGGLSGVFHFSQDPDPANPSKELGTVVQTPTLTDYKTFAFNVMCWNTDRQHKAWVLLSATRQLSSSTKRLIENHAASLGFNREDFVFLNPSGCERETHQDFRGGWSAGGAVSFHRHH